MPNHYTTIAICSPGFDFNCDEFNERHKETDLCRVIRPMPEEIEDVHSGSCPMPDGSVMTAWRQRGGERIPVDEADLRARFGAANWYDWAHENWGTKWGCYDMQAFELGGDSSPILIKFQTAWSPPSILKEIGEWLKKTCKFERVVWIGFDPYDDSTKLLE